MVVISALAFLAGTSAALTDYGACQYLYEQIERQAHAQAAIAQREHDMHRELAELAERAWGRLRRAPVTLEGECRVLTQDTEQ